MKKLILSLVASTTLLSSGFAGAGIFDSFVIVDSTFYDTSTATANTDFEGAPLGTFTTAQSINLGQEQKSFKNSSTDVSAHTLFYNIYESGGSAGSFTSITSSFQADLGGGDQRWGTSSPTTVTFSALTPGDYVLSIYTTISTNGTNADATIFNSDSGNNFEATFTVTAVPEPGTYALLAGCFGLAYVALKRRRA